MDLLKLRNFERLRVSRLLENQHHLSGILVSSLNTLLFQKSAPKQYDPYDGPHKDDDRSASGEAKKRPWLGDLPTGCRMGAIWCCFIAFLVLLINISVFLWALGSHKVKNGSGTVWSGECDDAKRKNALVQVGINILSTLLLSASNYSMHCLGAPTREEVDEAHAKKTSLQIGVPSLQNLKWLNRCRVTLWVILGLSALPIHFL